MRKFDLTVGGKKYAVGVERGTEPGRFTVEVDGVAHEVEVEEEIAPSPAAGAPPPPRPAVPRPAAAAGAGGKVLAPLPGKILSIEVSEGQTVAAGDKLLVLEAMKMENVIAAGADGVVKSILVGKDDNVEAGQELMVIE